MRAFVFLLGAASCWEIFPDSAAGQIFIMGFFASTCRGWFTLCRFRRFAKGAFLNGAGGTKAAKAIAALRR